MRVKTGLDLAEKHWPRRLAGCRAGLLLHPASVNSRLEHSADIFLRSRRLKVTALFGPQHGIRGETQDNMIEWQGFSDSRTGLPVYSLYGETRKPYPQMLDNLDVLVIDLQDVGARYYTFIWTMDLCMQAAAELGKSVVVLDRPNPVNGKSVEGNVLTAEYRSFVGLRPLPARHGMTVGEIALMLKDMHYPSLDLHVIPMQGWERSMYFEETGLPWVLPSPNMPTNDTAIVYPGMCLLEGTLLSEGRGTTRPFEIFGAPFIDPQRLIARLNEYSLPGVLFRPAYFEPTFQKHAKRLCGGAQIHVTDRKRYLSFLTGVAIIKAVRELYADEHIWKEPPYEYETIKLPFDILAGSDRLRLAIDAGASLNEMRAEWNDECSLFNRTQRKKYLLYA